MQFQSQRCLQPYQLPKVQDWGGVFGMGSLEREKIITHPFCHSLVLKIQRSETLKDCFWWKWNMTCLADRIDGCLFMSFHWRAVEGSKILFFILWGRFWLTADSVWDRSNILFHRKKVISNQPMCTFVVCRWSPVALCTHMHGTCFF